VSLTREGAGRKFSARALFAVLASAGPHRDDATPMTSSPLVTALRASDRTTLAGLLSEDVAFHSPVTDYRGRDEVVHLLATIGTVIDDVRVRRELSEREETVAFIEGSIGGRAVEGVLDQIHDEAGRVSELTLVLRPLDVLLEGVKRMGAALGDPR
jgi:hypothetical protein